MMVELKNPTKNDFNRSQDCRRSNGITGLNQTWSSLEASTTPEVSRFLQSERDRSQKSLAKHAHAEGFGVKKILKALQDRFSHTGDISDEVAEIVEAQVKMRTRDLFRQANYDALTHLPNRTYFNRTLERLVTSAVENDHEFGLLFLDLDGFKAVNDALGHQAGDELLRHVSARLISAVREGDIVSRFGGDEFVVLLAQVIDKPLMQTISQRIIDEVSRPYWINNQEVDISTSVGIARFPQDAKSSNDLVELADQALYVSKNSGKHTYTFYDEAIDALEAPLHKQVEQLNQAIQDGALEIVFEPQIDLKSAQIMGASVSAQWPNSPTPHAALASWAGLLKQSQSGMAVGAWLLDTGLYYLQQWQQHNDALMISIPVVDALWQANNCVTLIEKRLHAYGVSKSQVQFEFSLQTLHEQPALQATLNAFSAADLQITLTDVGKAPLDLTALAQLNLQELKLNADWLQSSLQDNKGQKWLTGLVKMAKTLDLCVIATGISAAAQAQQVEQLGVVIAQGDYWYAPLSATEFKQYLA